MIKISREDTQWAIAATVSTTTLKRLARRLPKELQDAGSKVVAGKEGFAALLVFGDLPDETLAKQLLASVTPVYLLDFDDDAPVTLKLDRKKTRVTETRVDEHPAEFLDAHGIVAPGYAFTPPRSRTSASSKEFPWPKQNVQFRQGSKSSYASIRGAYLLLVVQSAA
jgi:hypothetical protein